MGSGSAGRKASDTLVFAAARGCGTALWGRDRQRQFPARLRQNCPFSSRYAGFPADLAANKSHPKRPCQPTLTLNLSAQCDTHNASRGGSEIADKVIQVSPVSSKPACRPYTQTVDLPVGRRHSD
ncbi:hypothetical protein D1114_09070 [Cereibacter sphaeroides]|uniref:Uncharacterized protein n=1 Tax=Cereibacter sphaeroides TaxID=1063 RepID=A0AAX1UMG0_CERSP|nr:hypothetical protein D1114_09070 [Cereibacter sphaeroides]